MPHLAPDLDGHSPAPARGDGRARVAGYVAALGLVAAATSIGALARGHLSEPDLVLLYLLAVVIAAARFGRGPSLVAATVSVLAFDFFFIPPYLTFLVHEKRYVLTFAIMLVVSLVTSGLSLRVTTEERRSSLLSALSHDLRTPLAAITGAATTLRDESAAIDDAQRREMLDTICEEADRLERLVRNLLDMTRLESGALAVKRQWLPLEEIVGSALTRLESQLEGRPVRTDLPADLPLLSVDAVLLEQVFVNLLENAAKYTPPGSPVEIVARAGDGAIAIEVADRGPGIQSGDESRLFEKFFRGRQRDRPARAWASRSVVV